jgi:2-polyprenyl-3-methyl-5-hydroxy-6-metoxy-1,4-benzoquinol methylase
VSSPDPTSAEAVELLRRTDAPATEEQSALPPRLSAGLARVAARGRSAARGIVSRSLRPVYRDAVEPRVRRAVDEALENDPSLAHLREVSARGVLDPARAAERDQVLHATAVNLELLKSELRHMQHLLDELGMAFAPATGLAGAGARYAELRETVYALERRIRTGGDPSDGANAPAAQQPVAHDAPPAPATRADRDEVLSSTLFDYVGFERRFRGDPEEILSTLVERYGDLLAEHQPVVDIGCGRGELLSRLAERGIEVIGIEPDPGMAAEARARGITVHEELAGEWLRSVPDHSLGSIITTHVLEHLELDDMIELLELSAVKLRPNSVFISETPNPASLIVLGNSYLLDPTHVRPLHPSLLAFLCEKAGFREVRLRYFSPATGYHLPRVSLPDAAEVPAWARELATAVDQGFEKLNDVLFGPQDYAVVARTAPLRGA